MVQQYLEHSRALLSSPESRFKFNERRGLGRIFLHAYQNRYNLGEGLPILTTKKIHLKSVVHELLWFLKGDTNLKYLADNNVHIWDDDAFNYNLEGMVTAGVFSETFKKNSPEWQEAKKDYINRIKEDPEFAARWGELGPVYGAQWRNWPNFVEIKDGTGKGTGTYIKDPKGIDQIATVLDGMRKSPTSSRHIVTAWNPSEVSQMALPPCHTLWQLGSDGEQLDLHMFQRSCDMFLGVPFNIASYAILANILSKELGLKPGELNHTFGDNHFYTGAYDRGKWHRDHFDELKRRMKDTGPRETLNWINNSAPAETPETEGMDHVTGILEQLQRTPKELPRIVIADKPFDQLQFEDIQIKDYDPHPTIKRKLAV